MSVATVGKQSTFRDRIDSKRLYLRDFELPGLGEKGPDCGKNKLPHENTFCPELKGIRYEPLKCKRVECPDCYNNWAIERTFKIVVEIEAYARKNEERPHALTFSVPPKKSEGWSIKEINTSLFRRGYRRGRDKCNINGGYAFFHPARVTKPRKKQLERLGYGSSGDKGGWWRGVRNDAKGLGDWRKYVKWGPHVHNIGFPEVIKPHEGDDFVIHKYDVLDNLESVVKHTRYLISHTGVLKGNGEMRCTRPWGLFHHANKNWDGAKEELSSDYYKELCKEVAEMIGMEWNEEEGLIPPDEDECPVCGYHRGEHLDLYDIFGATAKKWQGGLELWNSLSKEEREFFSDIKEKLSQENQPIIFMDNLDPPNSLGIWEDEYG